MSVTHDTLVYFAKTFCLLWMMAFFLIAAVLTYRPSRKSAYERAARSVLPNDAGKNEGSPE